MERSSKWAEERNNNGTQDEEEKVGVIFDTVDTNKGYFGEEQQTITVEMLPGEELKEPASFVDVEGDGWKFDGWVYGGEEVTVVPQGGVEVSAN